MKSITEHLFALSLFLNFFPVSFSMSFSEHFCYNQAYTIKQGIFVSRTDPSAPTPPPAHGCPCHLSLFAQSMSHTEVSTDRGKEGEQLQGNTVFLDGQMCTNLNIPVLEQCLTGVPLNLAALPFHSLHHQLLWKVRLTGHHNRARH